MKKLFSLFLVLAVGLAGAFASTRADATQLAASQVTTDGSKVLNLGSGEEFRTLDSQDSYNFGPVFVNSTSTVAYTVTNTGTTPISFVSSTISGMQFSAAHSCHGELAPQERCEFEIRYWPMTEGFHFGRFNLTFRLTDGSTDTIYLDLYGEGRRL